MKKMKSVAAWAFVAGALVIGSRDSRAATWYVATNGSNSNPGTLASPFLTIQAGVDAASAGDTIIVRDGTYPGCPGGSASHSMAVEINKAGTSSAWITIQAEHKGAAILDGQQICHSYFDLQGSAAYWIFSGLDMRNCWWAGIWSNSSGGKNLQIRGNAIHDMGGSWNNNPTPGIVGVFFDAGGTNITIDGNVFHNIGRTAPSGGSTDHCVYTHGTNSLITNNVFYSYVNGWAIQMASGFSGTVANNVFFGPDPYLSQHGQIMVWSTQSNLYIRNNIFYNPTSVGIATYQISVSGSCSIDHNLVYSGKGGVGLIDSLPSGCSQSSNLLNADPKFANPSITPYADSNFQLLAGSPAIGAGFALPAVTLDFNGISRAGRNDIGAFQSGGGTTVVPPVISAVSATGLTQTAATIVWTTDKAADSQVAYGLTAAYGSASTLSAALTTGHSVALSGLTAGTVYHYAVKSRDSSGSLTTSPDATFTTASSVVTPPPPGCMTSASSVWQNASLAAQTGSFTAEFDATPGLADMDGVNGLSNGPASSWTSLAAAVRFNNTGMIDVRNGGAYAAAAAYPYVAGLSYHFRLVVSMTAHTYSAYVKQGANAEVLLGGGYAFRSEQASVATLNGLGAYADAGSVTTCNPTVTAAAGSPTVVSGVAATAVGQTAATIVWNTNNAADTQVQYGPTASYGTITTLSAALVTSHSAALGGLTAGTLYHYQVMSHDSSGSLAASPDETFTTASAATPPPAGCATSAAGAWRNASIAAQTGAFTAEFDATPGLANMDGVNGLSNGAASGFTSLAAIVRFNNTGMIDARNGGAYSAAAPVPYVAGMSYHFRLVVNLAARTYSAYVRQGANPELLIGSGYAFRNEQAAVTTLNNVGTDADAGSVTTCNAAVTSAAAPPPPPVVTPPVVSGVSATGVTSSGATIVWTTDKPADSQVVYVANTGVVTVVPIGSFYASSSALNPALTTSHSVALSGLIAGTVYHYAVKSRDSSGNLTTSPDATFTTSAGAAPPPPPPPSACVTSALAWQNVPLTPQGGAFTAEFDATPGTANTDAVSGLSNGAAASFTSLAAVVRFNSAGKIDARNGGAYTAAASISYAAGLSYHFRLVVNIPARTYSAYVKQGAGAEKLIGSGYAFRTEQKSATLLNNLGVLADSGSVTDCNATAHP